MPRKSHADDDAAANPSSSTKTRRGRPETSPSLVPPDYEPEHRHEYHVDTRSTRAHAQLHLQDHQAVPLQPLQPWPSSRLSTSTTSANTSTSTRQAQAQAPAPFDHAGAGASASASASSSANSGPAAGTGAQADSSFDTSYEPESDLVPSPPPAPWSQDVQESSATNIDDAVAPHDSVELVEYGPDANTMASHQRSPFLNSASAGNRLEGPYGTVSLTPSRNTSPASNDEDDEDDAHQLRRVSGTSRSNLSRRSMVSKSSSRVSEELDGAMLVSGLEGRFGMAEAPIAGGMVEEDMKTDTSEDVPLMGRDEEEEHEDIDRDAEDNSPHETVRASVPPTDDTTLSINTPRMWCLSVLFSFLGSSTNLFFSLRYPSVAITPVIALLLVHPLGHLWDLILKRSYDPGEEFIDGERTPSVLEREDPMRQMPKKARSWRLWLAQGRWNEKEHTCVYVSSNVAFGFAFATDVIVEQTKFYDQEAPIMYQILLIISTQILGYGFAGLTRRFLVQPSGMIWPGTLMSAAMFGTLHKQDNKPANGWTISRWNFFYAVFLGASLFYFLPGLLMPALSYFNVITWFAPKNVVISNLFGVSSGLGMLPLTFDWAQVTYIGSPLLVPFWAAVNVIGGLVVVMWLLAPILYYSNVLYTSYMPVVSTAVFDNTGELYNVSRILTPDFLFDREAYMNYSRVFLPVTYMLSYGVQFAGLAALLTHTACWHGKDIWQTWKKALAENRDKGRSQYKPVPDSPDARFDPFESGQRRQSSQTTSNVDGLLHEDIHCRLMRRYKDVPMMWYLVTFVSMAAIGMFIVEYYPIHLPWYGLLLSLGIGAIFFIPNGIIMAVTNQHSSIYLICQLICGAIFPGRPIANMVFVTYGYISSAQGIKFASDLKLGHYMKIPPRIMFSVQVVATLVSSLTQIGVLNWMFANVRGLCTPEAVNGFTCPIARVHFNGSILWGVVGVNEFFGPNAIYRILVWCFPIGAILPIPLWLYSRHKKHSLIRKVNLPVIFGAMSWIPPATGLNFSVWAVVCYVFNYHIKRRANAWWSKYTMTLSAALDSGLAFGIVIVFFGFIYPGWMTGFSWWGTEIYKQGCDWQACPYKTLPEGEHFGPDTW